MTQKKRTLHIAGEQKSSSENLPVLHDAIGMEAAGIARVTVTPQ